MSLARIRTQHPLNTRAVHSCGSLPLQNKKRVHSHPEENAESKGDAALQEELVRQIQKSMGKQRLIDAAKRSMEQAERERLKSKLKQAREQIEKRQKLELDRSKLEFDSRQAEVNRAADDFDEILRRSRADMESKRAENEEFERIVEQEQNQHLFFKGLYKREEAKKKAKTGKSPRLQDNRNNGNVSQQSQTSSQVYRRESQILVEKAMRILIYGLTAFNISALAYTGVDSLQDNRRFVLSLLLAVMSLLLMRYLWWARRRLLSESDVQ